MSDARRADLGRVLGTRQASILEYLWHHGPQSVATLHRALAVDTPVAYTTIFTELSRMLKKGLVKKSAAGASHVDMRYRAAVTREDVISSVVAQTLGALIDAHGPAAIHGFVDALSDDADALHQLRAALDARTPKKRPR